ncbi:NADH-quinone oxidoreductase subunit NuoI [Buchnera aphidicola]|uniref:NADH-quinone oxidoreductase subunit I n=1 Tax=Buchnera aphidicola subsp. Cinara cedri (strain Cc) TaxID=372461 RepID=NUOI_BUCCC|nr:NADH-quinone oxidoreductase subunit NuoI [Buchnera aphidicola]Q057W8.1 RecName: Full=NADH-quinone oxidoreductase subunit I; AltName: Full=NADH dehydrogenase I subunit I; AltName: Full=NDH-1 subunit I [Buchnera aphidicola BCc]ABJ90581.1 NADH dehydrogenase I chain I [Buchnera aphidicola BCc]
MNMKNIFLGFLSQIRSILMIFSNIFSFRETRLYPDEPLNLSLRYRGRIILTRNSNGSERCVACNLCSAVCPVNCISLKKSEEKNGRWYAKSFQINLSRCIFCGLCEEACPTMAIQLTPDIELSEFKRKELLYKKKNLLFSGPGKFSKYDFYSISGVNTTYDLKKNLSKKISNCVDVTDLLP